MRTGLPQLRKAPYEELDLLLCWVGTQKSLRCRPSPNRPQWGELSGNRTIYFPL